MTVSDLKRYLSRWRLNHVISKFSNSIQYLPKISTNCLYGPHPVLVYHSKSLVMPYNMKKHVNLFFYGAMDAVPQQCSRP
jgi:hypothetical protein